MAYTKSLSKRVKVPKVSNEYLPTSRKKRSAFSRSDFAKTHSGNIQVVKDNRKTKRISERNNVKSEKISLEKAVGYLPVFKIQDSENVLSMSLERGGNPFVSAKEKYKLDMLAKDKMSKQKKVMEEVNFNKENDIMLLEKEKNTDIDIYKKYLVPEMNILTRRFLEEKSFDFLGIVLRINPYGISVSLPNGIRGNIPMVDITDGLYSQLVQKYGLGMDSDRLEGMSTSDNVEESVHIPDWKKWIVVHGFIRVRMSRTATGKYEHDDGSGIELSCRPDFVNQGLNLENLFVGMILSAEVVEKEDLHYVLLVNKSISVCIFLSNASGDILLENGQLLQVRIVEIMERSVKTELVKDHNYLDAVIPLRKYIDFGYHNIPIGSYVLAKPYMVVKNKGIICSFAGSQFYGVLDVFGLNDFLASEVVPQESLLRIDIEEEAQDKIEGILRNKKHNEEKNEQVSLKKLDTEFVARVIYIDRDSNLVGLSVLSHVLREKDKSHLDAIKKGGVVSKLNVHRIVGNKGILFRFCHKIGENDEEMLGYARMDVLNTRGTIISNGQKRINANYYYSESNLKAVVVGSCRMSGHYLLSCKGDLSGGKKFGDKGYCGGDIVEGIVTKVFDFFMIVRLAKGLCGYSPIYKEYNAEQHIEFESGKKYKFRILHYDEKHDNVFLTYNKTMLDSPMLYSLSTEGKIVSIYDKELEDGFVGLCICVKQRYVVLAFCNNIGGILPINEIKLKDKSTRDIKPGDSLRVFIKKIEVEKKLVMVTLNKENIQTTKIRECGDHKTENRHDFTKEEDAIHPDVNDVDHGNERISEINNPLKKLFSVINHSEEIKIDTDESFQDKNISNERHTLYETGVPSESKYLLEKKMNEIEMGLSREDVIPKSIDEFEKRLISEFGSAYLWVHYMAYFVSLNDVESARGIARRALSSIPYRGVGEKYKIICSLVNLEFSIVTNKLSSTTGSLLPETIKEFRPMTEEKEFDMFLWRLFTDKDMPGELANEYIVEQEKRMISNYGQTCVNTWMTMLAYYYGVGKMDDVERILDKSKGCLDDKCFIELSVKWGLFNYEQNNREKAQNVFEELVKRRPKRFDIWIVYIQAEVKLLRQTEDQTRKTVRLESVRTLLKRVLSMGFPDRKKEVILQKFLDLESNFGTSQSIQDLNRIVKNLKQEEHSNG